MSMVQYSNYDKDTGFSHVIITGKRGKAFEGTARLHEEDKEYGSELVGCGIAHERAKIAKKKAKHAEMLAEYRAIKKFVKALITYKNFDVDSPTAKCVYKQLNAKLKACNKLAKEINADIQELNVSILKRDSLHNLIEKKD